MMANMMSTVEKSIFVSSVHVCVCVGGGGGWWGKKNKTYIITKY